MVDFTFFSDCKSTTLTTESQLLQSTLTKSGEKLLAHKEPATYGTVENAIKTSHVISVLLASAYSQKEEKAINLGNKLDQ